MSIKRIPLSNEIINLFLEHAFPNGPPSVTLFKNYNNGLITYDTTTHTFKLNEKNLLITLHNLKHQNKHQLHHIANDPPHVIHNKLMFQIHNTQGELRKILDALLIAKQPSHTPSIIHSLFTIRTNNIISKLYEFANHPGSAHDLIQLIKTYLPKSLKNVIIFGSAIYDPQNNNDLDLIMTDQESQQFINILNTFFPISLYNRDYSLSKPIRMFRHNALVKTILVTIEPTKVLSIDIVLRSATSLLKADFVETSLSQLGNELFLRYTGILDLPTVLHNIQRKCLTPVLHNVTDHSSLLHLVKVWKRLVTRIKNGWSIIGEIPKGEYLVWPQPYVWNTYACATDCNISNFLPKDLKNIVTNYIGFGTVGTGTCMCPTCKFRTTNSSCMVLMTEGKLVHLDCLESRINVRNPNDPLINWFGKYQYDICAGKIELRTYDERNDKMEVDEFESFSTRFEKTNDGWEMPRRKKRNNLGALNRKN